MRLRALELPKFGKQPSARQLLREVCRTPYTISDWPLGCLNMIPFWFDKGPASGVVSEVGPLWPQHIGAINTKP